MSHDKQAFCDPDHCKEPNETIFRHDLSSASPLLQVTSIGQCGEGSRFHIFHNGFSDYSIRIILGGQGKLLYRDQILSLSRGDVLLTSPCRAQSISDTDEHWSFSYIHLVGSSLPYYEKLWNHTGGEVIHTSHVDEIDTWRKAIQDLLSGSGIRTELEIHLLLTRLLTALLTEHDPCESAKEKTAVPSWVSEAAAYIADHRNVDISLDTIAHRFFTNRAHFSRGFKRYTGKTPKEYQTLCRLEEALVLLQGTDCSVAEIACRTGFASQSLFTKVFRRHFGQTPAAFRKNGLPKQT